MGQHGSKLAIFLDLILRRPLLSRQDKIRYNAYLSVGGKKVDGKDKIRYNAYLGVCGEKLDGSLLSSPRIIR